MDKKLEKKCDVLTGMLKDSIKAQKEGKVEKAAKITAERTRLTEKALAEPQYVNDNDKEILAKAARRGKKPLNMKAITKDVYGRSVVNQRLHDYHQWSDRCKLGVIRQQHRFTQETRGTGVEKANLETLARDGDVLWREYIQDGLAEYEDLIRADVGIKKAEVIYTTSTGYGAEWIPEIWSRDLIDIPHLPFVLLDNLPQVKMPSKNYTYGAFSGDTHFLIGAEQTSTDGSRVGAVDVGTTEVNFAAKKLEARLTLSTEESEDAIFNAVSVLAEKLRKCAAYDFEDAVINGDATDTNHFDVDIDSSTDRRKLFDGLRYYEQNTNARTDCGTLTLAKLAGLRTKLGTGFQNIEDLLYVGSPVATVAIGAADLGFKTLDLLGPKAFVLTGQVGSIAGVPYIESQKVRTNLNASGIYDGTTTTKTIVLCVHRPSIGVGYYKNLEIMVIPKPEYDCIYVIGRMRIDLRPMHASTNKIVSLGYNIA